MLTSAVYLTGAFLFPCREIQPLHNNRGEYPHCKSALLCMFPDHMLGDLCTESKLQEQS